LIEEKAEKYGRTVHQVNRWLPSSKMCSICGHVMAEMPLKVREWTCPPCGAVHDRDDNAARNILAAGRAERAKRLWSRCQSFSSGGSRR
jgi:putative transposase